MTGPTAGARTWRTPVVLLVCVLLTVAGLGAIWWGRTHQFRPATIPAAAAAPAAARSATGSPAQGPTALPAPGASASTNRADAQVALPRHLRIDALGIDTSLLHLGLDSAGAIAVPSGADAQRVAWFDGSPRPGQAGPAVVEAHVGTDTGPGPFVRLGTLRPGRPVVVTDQAGAAHTFTVYRIAQYPKSDFPTAEVYGNTAGPELRLITCGGDFDASTGHYRSNVVVYARAS